LQTDGEHDVLLIERKTMADLLASIKDGRYEEQSYRLIHTGEHCAHNIIYMIEGMFSQVRTPVEKRIILSAMTSLNHFKGFSVFRTCSLNETAENIVWMAEKMEREFQRGKRAAYTIRPTSESNTSIAQLGAVESSPHDSITNAVVSEGDSTQISSANYCTVVKKVKKDNITPENIGEIVLCQIPGISSVTAMAIMKQYGTFSKLIDEIRNNPTSLENIVCENGGKTRKISKTCVKNVIEYLGK
jgi:crossover junction endonuclease MUS81